MVKKCEFNDPIIQKIDSIIDNSLRDCHEKNFTHLIIYVNVTLILQTLVIMSQLISQFII